MPGAKVLYLGAASGTTVSHVSDLVGPVSNQIFNFEMHFVSFSFDSLNNLFVVFLLF